MLFDGEKMNIYNVTKSEVVRNVVKADDGSPYQIQISKGYNSIRLVCNADIDINFSLPFEVEFDENLILSKIRKTVIYNTGFIPLNSLPIGNGRIELIGYYIDSNGIPQITNSSIYAEISRGVELNDVIIEKHSIDILPLITTNNAMIVNNGLMTLRDVIAFDNSGVDKIQPEIIYEIWCD